MELNGAHRKYYATAGKPSNEYNTSWWSAVQTGLPSLGQGISQGLSQSLGSVGSAVGTALRRSGTHRHHHHKPFVAAHWEDPDYGDSAAGGSQVNTRCPLEVTIIAKIMRPRPIQPLSCGLQQLCIDYTCFSGDITSYTPRHLHNMKHIAGTDQGHILLWSIVPPFP